MQIAVGTKSPVKLQAVKDALALYPKLFPKPEIVGVGVSVDLHGHPKNLKETIEGAIARAKSAFGDCDYSFGLEGGLMEVPFTKTGFMEVGACAIYDGSNAFIGLSPAFEWPSAVNDYILEGKGDASQAFKELGLTKHEKIGSVPGGAIGFLTDGKMSREDFTKYSIIMALVHVERSELYR